jgi:DNA-binding NarL/FixJ family response regulator
MKTDTVSAESGQLRRVKALLIDDHAAVRLGICSLILQAYAETEIQEASNSQEGLEKLQSGCFDVVFLDLRLPERPGVPESIDTGKSTLRSIRDMDGPPVVVMSGEVPDRHLIEEIMRLGAATFVPKSAPIEVTIDAIRRALAGGVWLPPGVIGKGGATPPPAPESIHGPLPTPITHTDLDLTVRQFEVLRLALSGLTPAKIALTLGINHDNVKHYMQRLYERFGTANQVSLHAYFAKSGQTLGILSTLPRSRHEH